MRQSRLLALLGLIVIVSLAAPDAEAQTCATPWSATQVYTAGNTASRSNVNYRANWWTQGNDPATNSGGSGSGQPWTSTGACGGTGGDTTPPSVPGGLNSPSKTSTSVSLAWNASTDNTGVTAYDVYRGGALAGSPTSTSFNVTGLTANTTYSFTVRARDAAGNASAQSGAISVTTNTTGGNCTALPGVPTGLNSPSRTNTSVNLAWNASSTGGTNCTVSYRVFRGGTQVATGLSATSHTVSGLSANTTYSFTVSAVNQFGNSAQSSSISVTTNGNPTGGGQKIIGYFAQWAVYGRNYHIKNIHTSGSASKLTHINYAFGNVSGGQCVIGDSYADYDRFYSAAESVDGVADTWDAGALRGSFGQLKRLKQMYPHLKVLFSFGGWTWSGGFGQAAANPTAFANSCYNLLHDARWNGVFDGIDIDWEYPNACGLSCDTSGAQSFVTLMSALRSRFGSGKLVTAALPAGFSQANAANYGSAAQSVDYYNIMTYDFFGAWAPQGPTAPHSPLTSYTGIPTPNFYSDYAIQLYKSKGVPANKLNLGIGFYGRGWTGVSSANGGLNQPAQGAAQGIEPGVQDYKVLVTSCPANGTVAGTAYAFCNGNWWSYDTPSTIASKMTYKKNQGLGGAFFWELSGDTANGSLISALYSNR